MTQQDVGIKTTQKEPSSLFNILVMGLTTVFIGAAVLISLSNVNRIISENELRVEQTYGVTDVQIHSIFKRGTMTIMDGTTSKECQIPWDEDFQKPLVCNINYTVPVRTNP